MDEISRLGTWLWNNSGRLSALIAFLSWLVIRLTARWRLSKAAVPYSIESFVGRTRQGDEILHIMRWFLRAGIEARLRDEQGHTALVVATEYGQIETVRLLLSRRWRIGPRRTDPNRGDGNGNMPVRIAAAKRHRNIYDLLLDAGASTDANLRAAVLRQAVEDGDVAEASRRIRALLPNEIDIAGDDGMTALFIAFERGRLAILRMLVEANADPNVRHEEMTPLHFATRRGLAIVEELLRSPRIDVDAAGPLGETALILASEGGHSGTVDALLARKADAAIADQRGRTALMAAILGNYTPIVEKLRRHSTAGEAEARLMLAAGEGDENEARKWLDAGANPNAQAAGGRTALLDAARHGRAAVCRLLIKTGRVNVELKDDDGNTALRLATLAGSRELVAMLKRAGADLHARRNDGSTALMDAAASGHVGVVEELLKTGPRPEDVDAARNDGYTPLMAAVEAGERAIADRLLDAGASPNVRTEDGVTPLMFAITRNDRPMMELLRTRGAVLGEEQGQMLFEARRGNLERVQQLLDVGVSANLLGPHGSTPLLEAAHGGHLDVAMELIGRGADVNHEGEGRTALEWAIRGGRLDIVKLLLQHGAAVDARLRGGKTALLIACEKYHPAILDALLEAEPDVNAADDLGRTPLLIALVNERGDVEAKLRLKGAAKGELEAQLILAARHGDLAEVRRILANKEVNVDTPGPGGETALLAASKHADAEVVDVLLAAGADVNVKSKASNTPLTLAAERGDLTVLDTLLAAGASADLAGPDDRTPLMIAAENGHLEAVQHLLLAKNNPNEEDRAGFTALMLASAGGHTDVLPELIEAGAKVDAHGPDGKTALMFAATAGHLDTLRFLIEANADVDAVDVDDSTALILACLGGRITTVKELLQHHADVNACDGLGQTPLMIAILGGDPALVKELRDAAATVGEQEAALIQAARAGDVTTVRRLLADTIRINARRRNDDTALIAAIENGHSNIAHMLIRLKPDVNIKGRGGRTALIAASAQNDFALVCALTANAQGIAYEAMDENRKNAVLATDDPKIRLHLKTCGALQPTDTVYVTNQGRCYHTAACGSVRVGGKPSSLEEAAKSHLRPCSTCITNQ